MICDDTTIRQHAGSERRKVLTHPEGRGQAISVRAKTLVRVLGLTIVALVIANSVVHTIAALTGRDTMLGLVQFFSLDAERNLPTWYSSITLLISAFLLAIIAAAERAVGTWARHWLGLSVVFVALSADEAAVFHEMSIIPIRNLLGLDGVLFFAWVVPAAVLLLIGAILYARWFLHLPLRTQKLAGFSAILFISGAMGVELAGGLLTSRGLHGSSVYFAVTTLEETLEMCGVLCWIYTLLDYARLRGHEVEIRFTDRVSTR